MRGSVIKRGNSYSIVYDNGRDNNNKRVQKWESGFKTKKEANEILNKRLYEIQNGSYVVYEKQTLQEYLKHWYDTYVSNNLSKATARGYKTNIDKHIIPSLGNIQLNKLMPIDIQTLYNQKIEAGLSPTSVIYIHRVLHKALKQAVKIQLLQRNVTEYVDLPKKKRYEAKILDEEQVKTLLEHAKQTPIYIPVLLAVALGLRRGEALGLRWQDIDFYNITISINQTISYENRQLIISGTKTESSRRTILISSSIIQILREEKARQEKNRQLLGEAYKDNDLVFCYDNGSPISPASLNHHFEDLLIKANLPHIRFHDLRHTNATFMLKNNVPAKIASQRLGHSTIGITMDIYSHVLNEMQEDVANKIDMLLNNP